MYNQKPTDSNDGPIFWARPGEQLIPTDEIKDENKGKKRFYECKSTPSIRLKFYKINKKIMLIKCYLGR